MKLLKASSLEWILSDLRGHVSGRSPQLGSDKALSHSRCRLDFTFLLLTLLGAPPAGRGTAPALPPHRRAESSAQLTERNDAPHPVVSGGSHQRTQSD